MHLPTTCGMFGLLMAALLHVALTFPVDESALAQRESYLAADEVFGPELKERGDREKRKGGGFLEPIVEASFGIKSRVIGLIFGKINQLIDHKNRLVDQLDKQNIELNRKLIANQNCNTGTGGTFSESSSSGSTTNGGSPVSTPAPVYGPPAVSQPSSSFGQSGPIFTSSAGQTGVNYNPSVSQNAINYNPTAGHASIGYKPTGGQTVASFGTSFGTSVGQTGPSLGYLPPQTAPSYQTSGGSYQQNVPSTGNGNGYGYNY